MTGSICIAVRRWLTTAAASAQNQATGVQTEAEKTLLKGSKPPLLCNKAGLFRNMHTFPPLLQKKKKSIYLHKRPEEASYPLKSEKQGAKGCLSQEDAQSFLQHPILDDTDFWNIE